MSRLYDAKRFKWLYNIDMYQDKIVYIQHLKKI
jgi:hypothetical protein